MRFLEHNQLTTMTPGYFLVILPAKLESRNLMFRSTKKPNRLRNRKRIRRTLTAKNFKKSKNRMKNININLKRKKMPRLSKLNNFALTTKTRKISKTSKISRPSNSCRGQPKGVVVKFNLLLIKLFLMRPKDNLTKLFKLRSTKSTKKLITH